MFAQQFPSPTTSGSTTVSTPEYVEANFNVIFTPGSGKVQKTTDTPWTFTLNGDATFYPSPNTAQNESKVRGAYAAFGDRQAVREEPFLTSTETSTQITASLFGELHERVPENKDQANKRPDILTGNFQLKIPIAPSVTLPSPR